MFLTVLQMGVVIACGALWRRFAPGTIATDEVRKALSDLVYYLLLPALVLDVLWQAPLGADSARIAVVAAACVTAGLGLSWLACRLCNASGPRTGAMMLAAGFPNATYLGLPVLEKALGPWARSVAIQFDLFACTPLLLSLGMAIAARYGVRGTSHNALATLLRVPALWAVLLAVTLQIAGVERPVFADAVLDLLGAAVIPLMLLVLGMSLRLQALQPSQLRLVVPVLLIQLLLMPLLAVALAGIIGLGGRVAMATVLEAAMPSMVLGIVISDRFGLDTGLYAAAVTLTTVCCLATLPLWHYVLQAGIG
ncbi:MAG: AEC family transporter [Pseudomonadota bacterium]|nr:MAG: AEC family transporter [Pseudomonadota bacterium]